MLIMIAVCQALEGIIITLFWIITFQKNSKITHSWRRVCADRQIRPSPCLLYLLGAQLGVTLPHNDCYVIQLC